MAQFNTDPDFNPNPNPVCEVMSVLLQHRGHCSIMQLIFCNYRHMLLTLHLCILQELGRHDDLMSLFYIIVEFSCGQLPWRRLTDKDAVGRAKEEFDHTSVLHHLPGPQFKHFLNELQNLNYFADPDYNLLRCKLIECMEYNAVNDNDPFDWESSVASASSSSTQLAAEKPAANSPRYI